MCKKLHYVCLGVSQMKKNIHIAGELGKIQSKISHGEDIHVIINQYNCFIKYTKNPNKIKFYNTILEILGKYVLDRD